MTLTPHTIKAQKLVRGGVFCCLVISFLQVHILSVIAVLPGMIVF